MYALKGRTIPETRSTFVLTFSCFGAQEHEDNGIKYTHLGQYPYSGYAFLAKTAEIFARAHTLQELPVTQRQ